MFNLSFDTTNAETSVALSKKAKIIDFDISNLANTQSKHLFKSIETIFLRNKISYSAIDKIFVTTGPGSFTGIRIAIAAAQGIKLATQIPVLGISNFQVIAHDAKNNCNSFYVVLNARRDQFYIQEFSNDFVAQEPKLIAKEELFVMIEKNNFILCDNDMISLLPGNKENIITTGYNKFDARNVALAGEFFTSKNLCLALSPIYVRLPDASIQ